MNQHSDITAPWHKAILIVATIVFLTACGGGSSSSRGGGGQNSLAPPMLSISDAQAQETDSGVVVMTFDLTLSRSINEDITVDYATEDDTAVEAEDYTAESDSLLIPAGSGDASITIEFNGDECFEDDEEFLRRRSFQKDVAEAIYDAVLMFRAKRERAQSATVDR